MIILAGGRLVLPDRVLEAGSLVVEDDRIAEIEPHLLDAAGADVIDARGLTIVPGFVDVHVHGVEGVDVLDGPGAVAQVAARLPRYGVTAFCPTSVACDPAALATFLAEVARARRDPAPGSATVLPAHLESNFINPAWNGAQPAACLRTYGPEAARATGGEGFDGHDILDVCRTARTAIAIVTVAPELPGGLDLVRLLRDRGHRVSIGHSGATYEEAREAIRQGVTHATHLFNRMSPLTHRAPGVVGAVLGSPAVAAEIICDGVHVHPAAIALAVRAKTPARVMAITDGTAAAGLPVGGRARLGGRPIVAARDTAVLEDGTLAGSTITMDRAFRTLVGAVGLSLVEAAALCATTPAAELGLPDRGRLVPGARADFVMLGPALEVAATWMAGRPVVEHGT